MDALARHLAPLARRLRNLVTRATVGLVDDSRQMQTLQVNATADEVLDDCEHWQGYGLTVHPHPGGEALMLNGGGTRAMPLIIAVADRRYRMTGLEQGEVALHDDLGQSIVLRRDGIEITGDVRINGKVTITGDTEITGNHKVTGDTTLKGAFGQTGTTSLTGDLSVTGAATVTSTVAAGGLAAAGGGALSIPGSMDVGGTVAAGTLKMGGQTLSTSGVANVRAA